uniref:C-type lectin domain-containing protein n=1 Tax=Macrostomum lignano TaxID=282301 RepID=A0A1I8IV72_9PLAT
MTTKAYLNVVLVGSILLAVLMNASDARPAAFNAPSNHYNWLSSSGRLQGLECSLCKDFVGSGSEKPWTPVPIFKFAIDKVYLSPENVCGQYLGSGCSNSTIPELNYYWNVTLRPPTPGARRLRVAHISDVHVDMLYKVGASADCGLPTCCRVSDGDPSTSKRRAAYWGDYNCGPSLFDAIYFTGDLPDHHVWEQTREQQVDIYRNFTALLRKYFPNVAFVAALGNHESVPVNSFPPRYIKGNESMDWYYPALWEFLSPWVPSDQKENVLKWILQNITDPDDQLQWLISVLQRAESNGEKVHILGHIPSSELIKGYSWNYFKIAERYESTITGHFFGHTHHDELGVYFDPANTTRAFGTAYIVGSLKTDDNPSYRVYEVDGGYANASWQVLDYYNYIFNLTEANQAGQQRDPTWILEYQPTKDYGLRYAFPAEWAKLIDRFEQSDELFQLYIRFYHKSHLPSSQQPCTGMKTKQLLRLTLAAGLAALASAACVAPFIDRLGSCVFIGDNPSVSSWCDAARLCLGIGGELLMDLTAIRAANHWNDTYFIGVTDLLVEAGTSRSGWRFANGSLFPILDNSDWKTGLPNSLTEDDDFVASAKAGLRDREANLDKKFVCQPIATPNSKYLERAEFLRLGNISPVYCYTDASVSSELHCLWLCVQRWECRAVLFNRASGACRMLDFADSSVGDAIETDPSWAKFDKQGSFSISQYTLTNLAQLGSVSMASPTLESAKSSMRQAPLARLNRTARHSQRCTQSHRQRSSELTEASELRSLQELAVRRRDRLADEFFVMFPGSVSQASFADHYKVIVFRVVVRQARHPVAAIQNRKQRAVGESPAASRPARLNQEVRHSDEVKINPVIGSSDGSQVHQQLSADAQAQSGCVAPAGNAGVVADEDAAAQPVDEGSDAGAQGSQSGSQEAQLGKSSCCHLLITTASGHCVAPFIDRLGSCVFIGDNPSVSSWCDAARLCLGIGGELLMDLTAIRAANHWNDTYLIGVTDLLVEAGTSRSGWRFANGSLFPTLDDSDWLSAKLACDRRPNWDKTFVCQPIATPNSKYLERAEFLRLGNISPVYCYTDASVSSELHCLWLCVQRWECRAVLFNRASGACRMLDFADSSVGDAIETDPSWAKFVKKY